MAHVTGRSETPREPSGHPDFVDLKLLQSDFFLDKMKEAGPNPFEFLAYFEAFLSVSRSVTFALQAAMKGEPRFADWYAAAQSALAAEPLARFFNERRRESVHIGDAGVMGGLSYRRPNGSVAVEHRFGPRAADGTQQHHGVLEASERYMRLLVRLVLDWRREFAESLDPVGAWLTREAEEGGAPVEELELLLGFPPGWTDLPGAERAQRIRALTAALHGSHVDDLAAKYLA